MTVLPEAAGGRTVPGPAEVMDVIHNPCRRARATACAALGWWLACATGPAAALDEPPSPPDDPAAEARALVADPLPEPPGEVDVPPLRSADGTVSVMVAAPDPSPPPPPFAGLPPAAPPAGAAPATGPVALAAPSAPLAVGAPVTAAVPPVQAPAGVPQPLPTPFATELAARLLAEPTAADIDLAGGRPLTLIEALERSGDRARRLWITQAYWKASAAWATVRSATEGVERLDLVAPGGAQRDRDAVDAAAAAARADLAVARADFAAARQELADLVRLPPGEPLPWPVDRPLTSAYETHFQVIFASRPTTGRLRAIDRMLPHRHAAVEARAVAASAARRAVAAADEDHARGACPVEAVLGAHGALMTLERDWARDVRAYNTDVAEYVMAVADATVPDEQFARMLIGTPLPWRPPTPGQPLTAGLAVPGGPTVLVGGAPGIAGPGSTGPATAVPGALPLLVPPPVAAGTSGN